jgi:hypothetical protein
MNAGWAESLTWSLEETNLDTEATLSGLDRPSYRPFSTYMKRLEYHKHPLQLLGTQGKITRFSPPKGITLQRVIQRIRGPPRLSTFSSAISPPFAFLSRKASTTKIRWAEMGPRSL